MAFTIAMALIAGCEGFPGIGASTNDAPAIAQRDAAETGGPEAAPGADAQYGGLDEWVARDFGKLAGATLAEVRESARAFVLEHLPWWDVKGIATTGITGSVYLVGVDIESNGQRQTLNLIVRLFFADDGSSYWRAETITTELGQILAGYAIQRQRPVQSEPLAPQ